MSAQRPIARRASVRLVTRLVQLTCPAAVRATVREERRAEYREKGSGFDAQATIPVQNERAELVSFTPGR